MRIIALVILLQIISNCKLLAQYDPSHRAGRKFILHSEFPEGYDLSQANVMVEPYEVVCNFVPPNPAEREQSEQENSVNWEINAPSAHWMNLPFLRDNGIVWYLAEPGDSVSIHFNGKTPSFSGKGAPAWELVYKIHLANDSIDKLPERKKISRSVNPPESLQDYLEWCKFLDKKAKIILSLINEYRPLMSSLAYQGIKENFLLYIEKRRLWKFNYLRSNNKFNVLNQYGLSNKDLCQIFDTTMQGEHALWLINKLTDPSAPNPSYWWDMLKLELYRKNAFFFRTSENDSKILGNRPEDPFIKQYELAKSKFKGRKRELLIAYPFYDPKGIFSAAGFTPAVDSLLSNYYNEPGFQKYKGEVKNIEQKFRKKLAMRYSPPFSLQDANGNFISNAKLLGKIAVLEFWFTGCTGCVQMAPAIKKVADHFRNDTNVIFVSISIDKNKQQWLNSLKKNIFTSGEGIQLFTNGEGNEHDIIQKNYINSYPTIQLIDPKGKVIVFNSNKTDPRKDDGKSMIELIKNQLAISQDGPYVYYSQPDSTTIYDFKNGVASQSIYSSSQIKELKSRTDDNIPFGFTLKKENPVEPSTFSQPEKLFILSDIEGEFFALKKLLVNNKIIDNQFNWIFGEGHLVFAGDMFDRGAQVTECLWLIYSLEEKAKAAGGYVHFILGNHEIMNLQGDHRYVVQKYTENAAAINKTIKMLYGEKSELGKWLRSKNVIEKIGPYLFLHGGVSASVNNLPHSIGEINRLSRLCYDCSTTEITDQTQKILLKGESSPFWYRGYYGNSLQPATSAQIDSTLRKFGVKMIITGHTVIADTISVHFEGRIINTDTRHAEGKSEALLIYENSYFRTNQEGETRKLNISATK